MDAIERLLGVPSTRPTHILRNCRRSGRLPPRPVATPSREVGKLFRASMAHRPALQQKIRKTMVYNPGACLPSIALGRSRGMQIFSTATVQMQVIVRVGGNIMYDLEAAGWP